MLIVMIAIGMTDVLFALDSIPAIFGLTTEPFLIVFANAFALMGLRQLYFLVGGLLDRLRHLGYGLAVVLGFIAVKLVLEALHDNDIPFINGGRPLGWAPQIPVWGSLLFVIGALAATTATSLLAEQLDRHRTEHPDVGIVDEQQTWTTATSGNGASRNGASRNGAWTPTFRPGMDAPAPARVRHQSVGKRQSGSTHHEP
jgi:hypothetical protein